MTKNSFVVSKFYPGFVKKAISFTIDDGNYKLDKKFIDIVKPAGITGAFNLCGDDAKPSGMTDEEYREFYRGYEIANHVHRHPMLLRDDDVVVLSDEAFDPKSASLEDKTTIYKSEIDGMYYRSFGRYFGRVVREDTYIRLVDDGKRALDRIFGAENVCAFVWPYHEQPSERIKQHLKNEGYKSARKTGLSDFNIPKDKMAWIYNAHHANLNERAAEYEKLDTDELTFFCFGIHSHDYENNNCWDVLEKFAQDFGNRQDFYYATPTEIFDYADAADSLVITDKEIENPSDIEVYITVDRVKKVVPAHSRIQL